MGSPPATRLLGCFTDRAAAHPRYAQGRGGTAGYSAITLRVSRYQQQRHEVVFPIAEKALTLRVIMEKDFDNIVERLLEMPYWVIDLQPCQVPQDRGGQFFEVEQYYLEEPQHGRVCRQFADVLLKLNCYYDLTVSHGDEWVNNPCPADLVAWLTDALQHGHLCALIGDGEMLITASSGDIHMTLYNPSDAILELVGKLTTTAGLFLWQP